MKPCTSGASGVVRVAVDLAIADAIRHGAHQPAADAGGFEDRVHHVAGRRLAVRAGDADDRHLPARMPEELRREQRKREPRIADDDPRRAGRAAPARSDDDRDGAARQWPAARTRRRRLSGPAVQQIPIRASPAASRRRHAGARHVERRHRRGRRAVGAAGISPHRCAAAARERSRRRRRVAARARALTSVVATRSARRPAGCCSDDDAGRR